MNLDAITIKFAFDNNFLPMKLLEKTIPNKIHKVRKIKRLDCNNRRNTEK